MIDINIDYHKVANYSLFSNRIPICQSFSLHNASDTVVKDLQVVCEGEFIKAYQSQPLAAIGVDETVRIHDFEIVPDAQKLLELTERVVSSFVVKVLAEGNVVEEKEFELELMSYDQWLGMSVLPQTIVSFVTPNHPFINALLIKAAEVLKELNGSSQFTGYQSGSTHQVRQQVAAIFAAIHQCGIVYRPLPASYEQQGQRVTLPEQVLSGKLGNCIELTLLFASVLESVGINCGIILESEHAYLGVWLVDDSCAYSVVDDASFVEKKCSRGIDEMMVLESTMVTHEKTSFEEAVRAAEKHLAHNEQFCMFIDVLRCRLERVFPLPTRIKTDGKWMVETEGLEHDECQTEVKEHDRFDLSNIGETKRELTKLDIWERKLLDFSLRNSLLNLYLRRKAIQLISFDVDRIEDHLADNEEYCILPKPNIDFRVDPDERLVRSKLLTPLQNLVSNDVEHHRLHTFQNDTETKATLKNIYRTARSAIEETGANSLFVAIGALRWYENPLSETPHFAPILLMPVEMVYRKGEYFVRARDEETILNITLVEFLRQNYDIEINGLETLPKDDHGINVPLVFAILRDALKDQKRWNVEEECLLGTFSFSKFLMWNDVHSHREELMQNPVVSSLVENRLTWTPEPVNAELQEVDATMLPSEVALPVAADSSQMAAVLEGGQGRTFILYGPPGTGKSQTITNLIANALYQGKRVLFVAEKMAALSVVQTRLAKIGLDPFCLEMHSNKVAKRHILEQLGKALNVTHIVAPSNFQSRAKKLFEQRKAMIEYMKALHDVDSQDGLSLYDCIVRYESYAGQPLANFEPNALLDSELSASGSREIEELLGGKLDTLIKLVGQPSQNALNGLMLQGEDYRPDQVLQSLKDAKEVVDGSIKDYRELEEIRRIKEMILRDNQPEILQADVRRLYDEWRGVKAKWFLPKFFAKRNFLKGLRMYNALVTEADVDPLLNRLLDYKSRHDRIEELRMALSNCLQKEIRADEMPDIATLAEASETLARWIEHSADMRDWIHWCRYVSQLHQVGLDCVVEALQTEVFEPAALRSAFFKALYQSKAERKMADSPLLSTFVGMIFDEKVRSYIRLSEEFQVLTQKELYARLASRIPRVVDNVDSSSEIGFLNRNISNGGRGKSLRDLIDQIPTLLPRLCPCMLMSPMSVAQYLSLSQEKFDLVIFDEASQVPTSEAIGAIARGKSLIVVGDPKQMPPTSFFSSTNVDEEEASLDDMESILEDCRTLEIPSLQLNWHYRSRHESLIAFSNNEYYDGSLITFPSVDDQQTKVRYVKVEGYYDKGGKRSNKAEAEAIVEEVVRRLRDEELRQRSIGVIAFSVVQQSLIEDLLQERLEAERELRELADVADEPIFVKNLENVQGDERDVILFSIGYGPNREGKVSMNFGPLNNAGGERRLNVAVSRARYEMIVFSTLQSSQIDLRRSNARGVEGLKHFLEYAEHQTLLRSSASSQLQTDVAVAEQIAAALTQQGFLAHVCVGRSLFKVDIAVSHPDHPEEYLLGILLDGEGYRNTQTTRDREIVQPSVLRSLKWRVMRVWSVDWFNNPQRVIDRVLDVLRTEQPAEDKPRPAAIKSLFDPTQEKVEKVVTVRREYVEWTDRRRKNFFDAGFIPSLVKVEQPITVPFLARRLGVLRGLPRVSPAMLDDVRRYVRIHSLYIDTKEGQETIWLDQPSSQDYPWYRADSGRDVTETPMIEIRNAVKAAVTEQFSLSEEALSQVVAKMLGFARRGAKVESAVHKALERLKDEGVITVENGKLKLVAE